MIFDDYDFLNETIRGLRVETKLTEAEGDVEFLYQSSPPFFHQVATYELESLFRTEMDKPVVAADDVEPKEDKKSEDEKEKEKKEREKEDDETKQPKEPVPFLIPCRQEDMFKPESPTQSPKPISSSLLAKHLTSSHFNPDFGSIKLTIYLPDFSPMLVFVNPASTYEQVISKAIATHKQKGIQPPLRFDDPSHYELYLNEGDGIPDRDFVFRKTQKISENKVDEYCLCEIDEDDDDAAPTTASYSTGNRQSMMRGFDSMGSSNFSLPQPNTVVVSIPTSKGETHVRVGYDESTTMKQLLITLAKEEKQARKLEKMLYTEEFSFLVSPEDQARLKLMSQTVDMATLVCMFGDNCKFDLRRRAFEDSPRDYSSRLKMASSKNAKTADDAAQANNVVVYNETTAVMPQQWNVIKKNRLGQKQERIMGIDGVRVYNSLRFGKPGAGVKVPERSISMMQSVEVLEDKLTLRITWREEGPIEYVCQNDRDCAEIQGKLTFLLSRKPGVSSRRR